MAGQFGVTPDRMSWVVTIFLMTTAAFLLPLGKVSDVHGRRRTYSLSLIVFAMATAAAAFAQTLTMLIALRAIQGIALSGVYVSYMPLLLATTDEAHQGHILGRAVALTYLGLSLGPVIGGALTQFVGWRCIFLLSALAIVISYAFIHPIKEEWYANGAPFVNLVSSGYPSPLSSVASTAYRLLKNTVLFLDRPRLAHRLRHPRRQVLPPPATALFVPQSDLFYVQFSSPYPIQCYLCRFLSLIPLFPGHPRPASGYVRSDSAGTAHYHGFLVAPGR